MVMQSWSMMAVQRAFTHLYWQHKLEKSIETNSLVYSLVTIHPGKVVSFKHATQIPVSEVLPVKAINMHVFL